MDEVRPGKGVAQLEEGLFKPPQGVLPGLHQPGSAGKQRQLLEKSLVGWQWLTHCASTLTQLPTKPQKRVRTPEVGNPRDVSQIPAHDLGGLKLSLDEWRDMQLYRAKTNKGSEGCCVIQCVAPLCAGGIESS